MILTIMTQTQLHPRKAPVWHQVETVTNRVPQQGYLKYKGYNQIKLTQCLS